MNETIVAQEKEVREREAMKELLGLNEFLYEELSAKNFHRMEERIYTKIHLMFLNGQIFIDPEWHRIRLTSPLNKYILAFVPYENPDYFTSYKGRWAVTIDNQPCASVNFINKYKFNPDSKFVLIGWNVNYHSNYDQPQGEYVLNPEIDYDPEEYSFKNPDECEIITLIGSMRFSDVFKKIMYIGTLQGQVILTPQIFEFSPEEIKNFTPLQHNQLDMIHQWKMRQADYVLVVNPGGYIGDNTKEEIEWCNKHRIKVRYLGDWIVNHPKFKDALDSLLKYTSEGTDHESS